MTPWILILAGLGLRILSVWSLGHNFTLSLRRPSGLVDKGIYAYVRHPSYVGSMLVIAGLSILSPALAVLYLAFMFFLARALDEEQKLNAWFGETHIKYKQKTGLFLPRIKRRK
jgi:protein-S-isoprenylcysteine O-methyltransferase Ste14